MPIPPIHNVLYFGQGRPHPPDTIIKLYETVMEKLHVADMTSEEQAIIILELSQTIKNRFKDKYHKDNLYYPDGLMKYNSMCEEVLSELLTKI